MGVCERYLCDRQHTEHGGVQRVDALQLHPNFKTSSFTGKGLGLKADAERDRESNIRTFQNSNNFINRRGKLFWPVPGKHCPGEVPCKWTHGKW